MTRIDSHQHFWKIARGDYWWLTRDQFPKLYRDYLPDDLKPLLKDCGVDKTVMVQAAQTVDETKFLLSLADTTPFIAGVVGWVDFEAQDAAKQIAGLAKNKKLLGLRPMLQDLSDDNWILKPNLKPALKALPENGLRFDALIFPRHLPVIRKFLEQNPDLPVVIDHGAKPEIAKGEIRDWEAGMRAIARETRAVCKVSGLATEAGPNWTPEKLKPYVEVLLDCFGAKRLMWGSDWPVLSMAGEYTAWLKIAESFTKHLSADDRAQIFGGTAARFYGIA
jgi:L-fuconolactonase